MPRFSERRDVINHFQTAVGDFGPGLMIQYVLNVSDNIDASLRLAYGNDSTQDIRSDIADNAESFQIAGYHAVFAMQDQLNRVHASRYVVGRRAWRGLRGVPEEIYISEYYFSMDENWFREQVCIPFNNVPESELRALLPTC